MCSISPGELAPMTQKSTANERDNHHFDVIILGSGMSGTQMGPSWPNKSFVS